MNKYFDKIFVLNLDHRKDRLSMTEKRLKFAGIEFEKFSAVDGESIKGIHRVFASYNSRFVNANYLACAASHLGIYNSAIEQGFERILILEDDCRVHRDAVSIFNSKISSIPDWDLLYLGYIPLSDDLSLWNYRVLNDRYISEGVFKAKNLWGLYSYGISKHMMLKMLEIYDKGFPMEIDRFFVESIQQNDRCFGISPQLFCAEDGMSDNSKNYETGMMEKSIDSRYANKHDYV